tara:strand:+ start:1817 stop:2272 length:456 start_codon:yes stop_codon:yes gene_type:complete
MFTKKYLKEASKATHIRLGVGIILYTKKKLLLELRSDCKKWGLIGGGVEIGEDVMETAIRECFEETFIKINKNKLQFLGLYSNISEYRIIEYPDSCFHAIDIIYTYKINENIKPIKSLESLKLSFFDYYDLPLNLVPPAQRPINDFIKQLN